jgi:hypothetical protein
MSTQVFAAQNILRPAGMMQSLMDDPLSKALLPPPNETPEQYADRIRSQQQARDRSKEIDEALQRDNRAWERKKKAIKILLLGEPSVPRASHREAKDKVFRTHLNHRLLDESTRT